MMNSNRPRSREASIQIQAVALGGSLLLLLGTMFQLGELAYSRFCAHNAWMISMVLGSAWNTLVALVNAAGGPEVIRLLPLLLVLAGIALLLSVRRSETAAARRASSENDHD